jgi:hypothetical protein
VAIVSMMVVMRRPDPDDNLRICGFRRCVQCKKHTQT